MALRRLSPAGTRSMFPLLFPLHSLHRLTPHVGGSPSEGHQMLLSFPPGTSRPSSLSHARTSRTEFVRARKRKMPAAAGGGQRQQLCALSKCRSHGTRSSRRKVACQAATSSSTAAGRPRCAVDVDRETKISVRRDRASPIISAMSWS